MAKSSNKVSIFLSSALLISLVLIVFIAMAEARPLFPGDVFRSAAGVINCDLVIGVKKGDTCFDIANTFNMSTATFDTLNPNLNCTALFIGQWLCVEGF